MQLQNVHSQDTGLAADLHLGQQYVFLIGWYDYNWDIAVRGSVSGHRAHKETVASERDRGDMLGKHQHARDPEAGSGKT